MNKRPYDVVIVGAGIVGLATALEISKRFPHLTLVVLEKEPRVAGHQTGHNSGVIHSGLYYKPGSLKAKLCVAGAAAMVEFCRDHDIPHLVCGKIVVATEEQQLPALEELYRRGTANGVPGLRLIGRDEIRELEPHSGGIRGMHVPSTGITDYILVAEKYAELVREAGGEVRTGEKVIGLERSGTTTVVKTVAGEYPAKYVVNCAGLYSDHVSRMSGAKLDVQIIPLRGEYYDLVPEKHFMVRGLIYPVPDPRFPFLGVHFTRRIHGGVDAGPNALLTWKREGYESASFDFGEAVEIARYPGFWKMARKYWKSGAGEFYRSLSKSAFIGALQKLLPELKAEDMKPGGSGVRAQAVDREGKLVDDFRFLHSEGMTHVCNVPSPAATASLLIGRAIVDEMQELAPWRVKSSTR